MPAALTQNLMLRLSSSVAASSHVVASQTRRLLGDTSRGCSVALTQVLFVLIHFAFSFSPVILSEDFHFPECERPSVQTPKIQHRNLK